MTSCRFATDSCVSHLQWLRGTLAFSHVVVSVCFSVSIYLSIFIPLLFLQLFLVLPLSLSLSLAILLSLFLCFVSSYHSVSVTFVATVSISISVAVSWCVCFCLDVSYTHWMTGVWICVQQCMASNQSIEISLSDWRPSKSASTTAGMWQQSQSHIALETALVVVLRRCISNHRTAMAALAVVLSGVVVLMEQQCIGGSSTEKMHQ